MPIEFGPLGSDGWRQADAGTLLFLLSVAYQLLVNCGPNTDPFTAGPREEYTPKSVLNRIVLQMVIGVSDATLTSTTMLRCWLSRPAMTAHCSMAVDNNVAAFRRSNFIDR